MKRLILICAFMSALLIGAAPAQPPPDRFAWSAGEFGSLDRAMSTLATDVLAVYHDADRRSDLDNRFRLELAAGRYEQARKSLNALRGFNDPSSPRSATNYAQYDIFVRAKLAQPANARFDEAFGRVFLSTLSVLDDRRAAFVIRRFNVLGNVRAAFDADLAAKKNATSISLRDALAMVRDYQSATMYENFAPTSRALIARDDARRYSILRDVLIATPDGRRVCTYVVRPRHTGRIPALLEYSIYADRRIVLDDARLSAAFGYAGVRAFTPGTACSSGAIVPYVGEGVHGAAVIAWIARQGWSDGRVGMFGGSYNSFAQWAVAKQHPRALRALMPSVANAPGIDTPMEGSIFENWVYPWPPYVTAGKWLDAGNELGQAELSKLQNDWYVSGKAYRAMDRIDGKPNPVWDRWLEHPSYDAFWQSLVPYRSEFGHLAIPVLATDGYLSGQNVGGTYYVSQYQRYRPHADSYLVLGPYDHIAGQFGTQSARGTDLGVIAGYRIDPAAHIDIELLRYQWFDYVFKHAARPGILEDRINFEVMHANRWEHAPSIGAMHDHTMRLYLGTKRAGTGYALLSSPSAGSIAQRIDLADRADVQHVAPASGFDPYLSVVYESSPLAKPIELNGVFTGRLDVVCNKRDFDFNISIFARSPRGQYEAITNYLARASYVKDRAVRHLLTPAARTRLGFASSRMTSWRIPARSRIVVLVSINKNPGNPVNFGTGKNVSDETIADAGAPLRLAWFGDSFLDLPISTVR